MADEIANTALVFDATQAKKGADDFQQAGQKIITTNEAVEKSEERATAAVETGAKRRASARKQAADAAAAGGKAESTAADATEAATKRIVTSYASVERQLQQTARKLDPFNRAVADAAREVERLEGIADRELTGSDQSARAEQMLAAARQKLDVAKAVAAQAKELGGAEIIELAKVREKYDQAGAAARAYALEVARVTAVLDANKVGNADRMRIMSAVAREFGQDAEVAGGKVQLAAHQVTNLSYQLQDAAVQLAGGQNPFLIMMQQGPQATGAVGGLGNALKLLATPWTAAAAAAAAFLVPLAAGIARAVELGAETRSLAVSIQAMGASARATTADLSAMVEALRRQGVAAADAQAVARASLNPRLMSGVGAQFAALVPGFSAGTGLGAAEAMNKLVAATRGGSEAMVQLALDYDLLEPPQLRHIRDMAREGEGAQALQIVIAALERRFSDLHEKSLSPAARAMEDLGNAWRGMTTAIGESAPVVVLMDKLAGALNAITGALSGDWSKFFRIMAVVTAPLPAIGTMFQALTGIAGAIKSLQGSGPPVPVPRPGMPAAAPVAPTTEQIEAADRYADALKREQAVLAASLPHRAAVRAAQEAQQYIDEKGLTTDQARALTAEKLRTVMLAETDAIRQQAEALARSTAAALAQADAWQRGATAAGEAAARSQAIEMAATKAGVAVDAWTRRILDNNAAQAAADLAKSNSELAERAVYLNKIVEAETLGAAAVAEVELQEKQRLATKEAQARLAKDINPDIRAQLEWEIENTKELTATIDRGERTRAAAQALRAKQQELLLAQSERDIALEDDPTRRAAMELTLQHKRDEYEIRQRIGNDMPDQIAKELALADAVARTRQEAQQYEAIRAKGAELFNDLADMVEQAGQRGGKGFFASFVDWGRAAIKTLAREMLFRPIIQPVLTSLVGSVPQLFGLAGASGASAASSGGLGSIMSPITDILGMAKNFAGDIFGTASSWMNNIGASLGFASTYMTPMATSTALGVAGIPGGVTGSTMGAATNVGGLFGSTTLSGFLGGAGLGFGAGSLLNSLLGGSQVGGTVGSGIGSLAGAGLSLIPGMQIPGMLLSILGGAGGGLLGGLLGGDEQRPLGNAQLGAVKNGRLTFGSTTTLDGYDNSREIAQMQQAVSTVNSIIDKFGLTLNEDLLRRGFEDTSNPIGLIGKTSTFDGPANLEEWFKRFFGGREGQSYLGGATGTLGTAFDRLASGGYKPETGDDVLKMLDYAGSFDDAVKRAGAGVNTLARQTLEWEIAARDAGKGLQKTVKDYIQQATDYFGAGSTQEAQAQTAQRQAIYAQIGLDPGGSAIDPNAPSTMLTGRDADLAQARAQIAAYQDALVATGLTAEEAAAKIAAGNAATAAAINARWDESDRRTSFGFGQREDAAKIALGGYGVDAQAVARAGQAEQQRQELYDAEAAGMSRVNQERLKSIQLLEVEALRQQQIEGNRRTAEGFVDRQNAALVAMGRQTQAQADTEALLMRQRQERWDAERDGTTAVNREMLVHTQQLEREALAYTQAAQAAQEAAQAAGALNASLTSVAVARAQAGVTAANTTLTDTNTALATAEQNLNAARSTATASLNDQVNAWTNAANSLRTIREQLLTGNLNPVDLRQQMMLAQQLYQDAQAQAGTDPAAAASLGSYAQQYLQSAMAYLGPNIEYARIFEQVTGTLRGTETVAQQQARTAQSQLDQLKTIAGTVLSIDEAFAAYTAAQAAQQAAQAGATAATGTMNSGLKGQFDTLAGQYSAYMASEVQKVGAEKAGQNAEAAFGGSRDQILAAITDWKILNQIGEQYYRNAVGGVPDAIRIKVLQLGGVPSFELGGLHAGGLRLVGERGPELEVTGSARYWSAPETRAMLAPNVGRFDMPRMPTMPRGGSPDAATVAEMRGMRDEIREIRKGLAELNDTAKQGNRIAVGAAEANVDVIVVSVKEQREIKREIKRGGIVR